MSDEDNPNPELRAAVEMVWTLGGFVRTYRKEDWPEVTEKLCQMLRDAVRDHGRRRAKQKKPAA